MAATIAAMTLTTLSCKNGAKEQPAANVEQADTTAATPQPRHSLSSSLRPKPTSPAIARHSSL